ncbi:hypothetical protein BS78_10G004400 [Paspalum vaginatum]|nr:hypothetical protein BS78_10G004400 [Paspalum vaginatum]
MLMGRARPPQEKASGVGAEEEEVGVVDRAGQRRRSSCHGGRGLRCCEEEQGCRGRRPAGLGSRKRKRRSAGSAARGNAAGRAAMADAGCAATRRSKAAEEGGRRGQGQGRGGQPRLPVEPPWRTRAANRAAEGGGRRCRG